MSCFGWLETHFVEQADLELIDIYLPLKSAGVKGVPHQTQLLISTFICTFLCVCVLCLSVCLCTMCMHVAHEDYKRALYSLEMELQKVMSQMLGPKPVFSSRVANGSISTATIISVSNTRMEFDP